MQKITWNDGMVLGREHLELLEEHGEQWAEQLRGLEAGHGLCAVELDPISWDQGFLRWNKLRVMHACGELLEQGSGFGVLQPPVLTIPEAVQGSELDQLSIWIWPTNRWQYSDVTRDLQKISTRKREWSQSFIEPSSDCAAVCIQRYQRRGRHWVLDPTYFPPVLRVGASVHWEALLIRLEQWCQGILLRTDLSPIVRAGVQCFAALLLVMAERSVQALQDEWLRLLGMLGVNVPRIPSANGGSVNWVPTLWNLLENSLERKAAEKTRMRLEIPRANATLFSTVLQSEDWNSRVLLVWTRFIPFVGDEHQVLRLASLGQMPRLVRAALPGVSIAPHRDVERQGAKYLWSFHVDIEHVLWKEIQSSRSLAVHCPVAGEQDSFALVEAT